MKHKGSSARAGLLHEFGILVGCNLAVGGDGGSRKIGPSCWDFTQGGVSILTICSWGLTVHLLETLSCPRGLKQKRKRMRLAGRPVWSCGPPPPPGRGHLSAPAAGRPGRGEPGRRPAGARPKSGHVRAAPGPRGRRPPRAGAAAATTAARIFGHAGHHLPDSHIRGACRHPGQELQHQLQGAVCL